MKLLGKLVVAAVALVVLFGTVTLIALEGTEVVVLETKTPRGPRRTRVWIADYDGTPWIEAASSDRDFHRDILQNPDVEIERGGQRLAYQAVVLQGHEGHALIRGLLRQKYGWADWWIGMLADTSGSLAIRLEPKEGSPE